MGMNNPPLVAHIIFALGTGGLENGLVNIINRTPADKYRHAIICLTKSSEFAGRITAANVEVVELNKKPGHDLGLYWRIWGVLRRLNPQIVHTRNLTSLEMQLIAFMLPGVKRVHGEHGRDIQDLDGSNKKYNALRRLIKPLVHKYIAVSEDLKNWLIEVLAVSPEKVRQIYNGVDTNKFSPAEKNLLLPLPENFQVDNRLVIGTVGRLAEVKNQLALVEAFGALIDSKPELRKNLRLVIVGDGPMQGALQSSISALGMDELVWLAGDRSDIPDFLRLMDIFVLPSLGEGISNTVLEAMASGLPIIATKVGGNPELVEHNVTGLLVPVNDFDAITLSIKRLVEDPELRQEMGRTGLAKITETFNWDKTVSQYLAVYDELLQA